jgi:hypothetical protein
VLDPGARRGIKLDTVQKLGARQQRLHEQLGRRAVVVALHAGRAVNLTVGGDFFRAERPAEDTKSGVFGDGFDTSRGVLHRARDELGAQVGLAENVFGELLGRVEVALVLIRVDAEHGRHVVEPAQLAAAPAHRGWRQAGAEHVLDGGVVFSRVQAVDALDTWVDGVGLGFLRVRDRAGTVGGARVTVGTPIDAAGRWRVHDAAAGERAGSANAQCEHPNRGQESFRAARPTPHGKTYVRLPRLL